MSDKRSDLCYECQLVSREFLHVCAGCYDILYQAYKSEAALANKLEKENEELKAQVESHKRRGDSHLKEYRVVAKNRDELEEEIDTLKARIAELESMSECKDCYLFNGLPERDAYHKALEEIPPVLDEFLVSFLTDNAHLPFAQLLIENFRPVVEDLCKNIKRIATNAIKEGNDG